jgi:osmotically-inducible protein OsmY
VIKHRSISRAALALLLGTAGMALPACAPLLIGGAMVGGGLVASDRRSTGTQVEDQAIEIKAASRISDLATLGHVDVVSYNRTVLVTGEVPDERAKLAVGKAVAGIDNVRSVVNELSVQPNSSIGSRSQDAFLVTKVKATMLDAKDIQASAFKVVSERGYVYLMGRVTEREAERGAALAASVPGVIKVVRVFDILTPEQLAALGPDTGQGAPITTAPKSDPDKPAAKP